MSLKIIYIWLGNQHDDTIGRRCVSLFRHGGKTYEAKYREEGTYQMRAAYASLSVFDHDAMRWVDLLRDVGCRVVTYAREWEGFVKELLELGIQILDGE